jgi:hypothetical protein
MESAQAVGVQAPADAAHDQSPETYVGNARAQNFRSPGGLVQDRLHSYAVPSSLDLNQWALGGTWSVDSEKAVLSQGPGKIAYRFYARDLHLVLGSRPDGKLPGSAPGANHDADTDANGDGVVTEQRLYQLIRQATAVGEHVFSIEFFDTDVQAYSFTFG